MFIIIHPNFRNGGAERSALNQKPNLILTYGPLVDQIMIANYPNVIDLRTRLSVILQLLKLYFQRFSLEVHTNQLSACYFWVFRILPGVQVVHWQRLSLMGELFLTRNLIKRLFVKIVFVSAPFVAIVRVPSVELVNDYRWYKNKIQISWNKILDCEWEFLENLRYVRKRKDIVIISRLAPEKKLLATLELLDTITNVRLSLTVVGCVIDNSKYKNLDIDCFELINEKTSLLSLIAEHRFGVLFSYAEGFGNVLIELIAAGTWPIINQIQWGPTEIINTYKVGTILDWSWESSEKDILKGMGELNKTLKSNYDISDEVRRAVYNRHRVI